MNHEEIQKLYIEYRDYVDEEIKKGFYTTDWFGAMMKFGAYEMLHLLNNKGLLNPVNLGKDKKIVE